MPSPSAPHADLLSMLAVRSRVLHSLRRWFERHGFLEVETPVRIARPALELHIDAAPAGDAFLRTSPELHMKRLLAAGAERIFQIGPCFREGERGARHNPEFTLLEWYRVRADYRDVLTDTRDMLMTVCRDLKGDSRLRYGGEDVDLGAPWAERSVRETFLEAAGWDPVAQFDDDRFDVDLVGKVEPMLPADRPAVLKDYPAAQAALARLSPGDPRVAERWELYVGGMELANAFSELTDPVEQRARFEACARRRRERGKPVYAIDEDFLSALATGLPACAGVALGVDRLVMLLADAESIDRIRPFSR